MHVTLRTHGIDTSEALRTHCERRLELALGRFRGVGWISVYLTDVNGPRGGEDIACLVQAHVAGFPDVVVRAVSRDAYAAIDVAAAKVAEAVARHRHRAMRERVTSLARGPRSAPSTRA